MRWKHGIIQCCVAPPQASTLQTDRSADPELVMFTADLLDAATSITFAGDIPQIVDLLHFSVDVLANSTNRSVPPSHEVCCMVVCLFSMKYLAQLCNACRL